MIITALIATSTKVLVLEAHQFLGAPKMLDDAGLSRDHTGRGWARPRRQSSRSECVGRILDDFGRRGRVGKQRSRESRTSLEVPDHYKRENPGGGRAQPVRPAFSSIFKTA